MIQFPLFLFQKPVLKTLIKSTVSAPYIVVALVLVALVLVAPVFWRGSLAGEAIGFVAAVAEWFCSRLAAAA